MTLLIEQKGPFRMVSSSWTHSWLNLGSMLLQVGLARKFTHVSLDVAGVHVLRLRRL